MADFWKYWRVRARKRKKQIFRNIKDLRKYKTLLYIGAHTDRLEMIDIFHDFNYEIDVLEIWGPNVKGLIELNEKQNIFRDIIQGDILDETIWGDGFGLGPIYDIVMFWHGPEHVKKERLPDLIKTLEALAKHYVIMACPIGKYKQGPVDGNPYEVHESYLWPEDFIKYNYKADCIIKKKKARGSNMVLWKKLS